MDTVSEVCMLLEKKKGKFNDYETATLAMLHCEAEDVEKYITQRGILANEIDELTEEIGQVCDREPNGRLYFDASSARTSFKDIPPELHPVFELGQQILSYISRIGNTEQQVLERLEMLKEEARGKIKENQNVPKIKQYLNNLGDQPTDGNFTSNKV